MEPNFFRKILIVGLVLTLSLVLNSLASFGAELDDIKAAIKAKGAKWTAGETSVSRLSTEQKQRRLGSLVPEGSGAEQLSLLSSATSLPASLDWRNYNGKNFVTPVRNIETCSSSWAFAPTACLESYTLRKNNTPGVDLNLSEQVLISCANAGSMAYRSNRVTPIRLRMEAVVTPVATGRLTLIRSIPGFMWFQAGPLPAPAWKISKMPCLCMALWYRVWLLIAILRPIFLGLIHIPWGLSWGRRQF
jgi:hypothetical protein